MQWQDEGYLLSKKNFNENSLIIEVLTLDHGKYNGIVYGGLSRKHKKNFQIGNKIMINWRSKSENKMGYFNIELLKPISPLFFDDKKRSICILSLTSILKILLPDRQINQRIFNSFELMINNLNSKSWIELYLKWELSLIKELGYEVNIMNNSNSIVINRKSLKIPKFYLKGDVDEVLIKDIKEALIFNKELLLENFINPNKLRFPLFRNILESYYR